MRGLSGETKAEGPDTPRPPTALRRAVYVILGLVTLGALYLIAVRGEAILLDLAAAAQFLGCW